jgi:hypothetical protein
MRKKNPSKNTCSIQKDQSIELCCYKTYTAKYVHVRDFCSYDYFYRFLDNYPYLVYLNLLILSKIFISNHMTFLHMNDKNFCTLL